MKELLNQLKRDIKDRAEEGRELRKSIEALCWKEGSLPEVQAIRSKRDEAGRHVEGKRALKRFRRPETGPERYRLWDDKRAVGDDSRYFLLLYGMLRGRSYASIEKKCRTLPSAYHMCILLGVDRLTKKSVQDWLDGGESPTLQEAAA